MIMSNEKAAFRQWCIVELFGHSQIAGEVSEQRIGDSSFVRIDVPEVNGQPAYTKLYGEKAIYAITPTDEATAKRFLQHCNQPPVNPFYLREPTAPALPDARDDDHRDSFDDFSQGDDDQ
jgi:hypothetical protein